MVKPRVFISSTYYDLRHIRAVLENFVIQIGFDAVLFEKGDIPFHHDISLEHSCLKEVDSADILVLIIGGRYGSLSKEDEALLKSDPDKYYGAVRSVTTKEYEKARDRDIPIFVFVEAGVLSEFKTYKENRSNKDIKYAHVDDVRIYHLLDDIYKQSRNNFVREFTQHEDITSWLRDQWAGIFGDFLRDKQNNIRFLKLEQQITELASVVEALKGYSEEIIKSVNKTGSAKIIRSARIRIASLRATRFMREELIEYLRKTHKVPFDPEKTYHQFEVSTDLEDFLAKIGVPKGESQDFRSTFGEVAAKDYDELKLKYFAPRAADQSALDEANSE